MEDAESLIHRQTLLLSITPCHKKTERGEGADVHVHRSTEMALNTLQASWLQANS